MRIERQVPGQPVARRVEREVLQRQRHVVPGRDDGREPRLDLAAVGALVVEEGHDADRRPLGAEPPAAGERWTAVGSVVGGCGGGRRRRGAAGRARGRRVADLPRRGIDDRLRRRREGRLVTGRLPPLRRCIGHQERSAGHRRGGEDRDHGAPPANSAAAAARDRGRVRPRRATADEHRHPEESEVARVRGQAPRTQRVLEHHHADQQQAEPAAESGQPPHAARQASATDQPAGQHARIPRRAQKGRGPAQTGHPAPDARGGLRAAALRPATRRRRAEVRERKHHCGGQRDHQARRSREPPAGSRRRPRRPRRARRPARGSTGDHHIRAGRSMPSSSSPSASTRRTSEHSSRRLDRTGSSALSTGHCW